MGEDASRFTLARASSSSCNCFHGRDVGGTEVPIVQGDSLGYAQSQWDGVQGWDGLSLIVGMVRQGAGHNQETVLFHSGVSIVMLIKAIVVDVFHDA